MKCEIEMTKRTIFCVGCPCNLYLYPDFMIGIEAQVEYTDKINAFNTVDTMEILFCTVLTLYCYTGQMSIK